MAALWTLFLARCADVSVPSSCIGGMFLAVWMLYAADRLLDATAAQRQERTNGLELRHRFHFRHRRPFLVGLVLSGLLLLTLLPRMGERTLWGEAALGLPLLLWLLRIHAPHQGSMSTRSLPKELAVGPFFALAIALPTLARAPERAGWLLSCAGLLAAVCALNCVLLYSWEHNGARQDEAHRSTAWALRHLHSLGASVIAAGVTLACVGSLHAPGTSAAEHGAWFALACVLAVVLLLLLDRHQDRFDRLTLRAAGDAALLTPLLFLALLR